MAGNERTRFSGEPHAAPPRTEPPAGERLHPPARGIDPGRPIRVGCARLDRAYRFAGDFAKETLSFIEINPQSM